MTSLDLTFFLALSPQPRHPEKLRFSFQPGLHGFLCQSQGGYVYEGPEMSEMFSRVWEGPEAASRAWEGVVWEGWRENHSARA